MLSRRWLLLPLLPLVVFSSDALASSNVRSRCIPTAPPLVTHVYATLQLMSHLPPSICFTHAQPRPRRDVAAAQPDKSRDKAEAAGAGPSSWEVPARQLSACQTASQAIQQVRLTGV